MLDSSRRLVHEWQISGMEEDGCSVDEAGLQQENTWVPFIRSTNKRLQQMAYFLVVVLLLLILAALAPIILAVLGGRSHQSPESQSLLQPNSYSSGFSDEQQKHKDFTIPRAMLTAPRGNISDGKYIEWESGSDNAFCRGGVSYSRGNLVVPSKGIYRVFLQITYESKSSFKCDMELRLHNEVYVYHESYPEDMPLFSSFDTVSCSLEYWKKSLYTAGLFSLESNSSLRVSSSHSDLIVKNPYEVFFGAEFLSQ